MSIRHQNVEPVLCVVCGKEILAGTGKFVVEGGAVRLVHSGGCATSVGAAPVPGGVVVWGERSELASHMIAHDGMSEIEAAETVKWRPTSETVWSTPREATHGFAVVDALLKIAIIIVAVAFLGLAAVRVVVGLPVAVDRGAAHAAVAERVSGGVSR